MRMNVDYINPFISASVKVFRTFASIESTPGLPAVSTSLKQKGYVNGYIGLEGHGISGYFVINFSQYFLQQIFKNVFGSQIISTEAELFDAAGELTNMISGKAKAELSEHGFFFDVDVPRISHQLPKIPKHLKKNPVIFVPIDTKAGDYAIQASILTIEEDFATEDKPDIPPPEGMVSVAQFSEFSGMAQIKIKRFLKTGFLKGTKVSRTQWHIPVTELEKIQGRPVTRESIHQVSEPDISAPVIEDDYINITKFSKLSGLPPAKIKRFLRSGFLKGVQDKDHTWYIKKALAEKFRKS